jgi:DNA repair protein RadA/Sms
VGLTGDLRFVSGAPRRVSELLKMGFARIIRPEGSSESRPNNANGRSDNEERVIEVGTLEEAVAVALL